MTGNNMERNTESDVLIRAGMINSDWRKKWQKDYEGDIGKWFTFSLSGSYRENISGRLDKVKESEIVLNPSQTMLLDDSGNPYLAFRKRETSIPVRNVLYRQQRKKSELERFFYFRNSQQETQKKNRRRIILNYFLLILF